LLKQSSITKLLQRIVSESKNIKRFKNRCNKLIRLGMVENIFITSINLSPFSPLPSSRENLSKKKQYKIKLMEKSSIVIGVFHLRIFLSMESLECLWLQRWKLGFVVISERKKGKLCCIKCECQAANRLRINIEDSSSFINSSPFSVV